MDILKFEEAKVLKDKIEVFKQRIQTLEESMKACRIGAIIEYTLPGEFRRKGEFHLHDQESLLLIIDKEYKSLKIYVEELEREFENL